jgi:hypothetical protein
MGCSDFSEDMMEVLYGEASSNTVLRLEEHVKGCPSCREEMAGFEGVRRKLGDWKLPLLSRPPRANAWLLSFRGLAAAAILVFALGTGLGLSGSEVRYQDGRLSFHLGHSESDVERRLAEQRAELSSVRAEATAQVTPVKEPEVSGDALLKKVEGMIRESDERHSQLVQASLEGYRKQVETQRRLDLARVSAGFSYLEGKTGQDVARTAQLVGYVMQASDKR